MSRFKAKIFQLYKSIGLDEKTFYKDISGELRLSFAGVREIDSPEIYGQGWLGKVMKLFVGLVLVGAIFLFPLTAQVIACWRMIILFGWTWWVIVPFAILFLVTINYTILFAISSEDQ
jgi:hypothetical protein